MPAKFLKTSFIAKAVGVHPNTVRLYEQWGLLMPVDRNEKGYRLYTELHLEQMRLARIALRCEFIAGNIRAMATDIVKTSAAGNYSEALDQAYNYLEHIRSERIKAEEAVALLETMQQQEDYEPFRLILKRKEAAKAIGVSMDVLRNWERNGLLDIQRGTNGYRCYGTKDIQRMKIIYALRSANHSMMAVLRMLTAMDRGSINDIEAMKREKKDEDIRYATDRWLAALVETEKDTEELIKHIRKMINRFKPSSISPGLPLRDIIPEENTLGGIKMSNVCEFGAIVVKGAKENNLKSLSVRIPKNKLVVLTGLSGSGKSSLAYDTLQKECQRQYMESMGMVTDFISKPKVESISGLSPSISVDQHMSNRSPRSTVGTSTEIYTYLRILFARLGERDCPSCGRRILPISNAEAETSEIKIFEDEGEEVFPCPHCGSGVPELSMSHFSFNKPQGACPACTGLGTIYEADIDELIDQSKNIVDGAIKDWDIHYIKRNMETISAAAKYYGFEFDFESPVHELGELQKDLLFYGVDSRQFKRRFPEKAVPDAASRGRFEGIATNVLRRYAEHADNNDYREKLGKALIETECHECGGTRLKEYSRKVTVEGRSIIELSDMSLEELSAWIEELPHKITEEMMSIAAPIINDLKERTRRFLDAGIGYLSMNRTVYTLSGGEAQRLRLASLLGSGLTGVLYVLDEPTTGLHSRDTGKLVTMLKRLRDLGNTVLVIEHDPELMLAADYIIDMGPGAGKNGGEIIAEGTPDELAENESSITGRHLKELRDSKYKNPSRRQAGGYMTIKGATEHNLKNIDIRIPIRNLVAVTGVSGSGKSTLIFDLLDNAASARFNGSRLKSRKYRSIEGLEQFERIITVDQTPIGRVPRSNAATYTDIFTSIRNLYARLPVAIKSGMTARHFSFNVPGGRCEKCEGAGVLTIPMHFLPDVTVTCPVCKGKRFKREVLEVRYKGKSIADVLDMTVQEGYELFSDVKEVASRLKVLVEVGMGYLQLGQPATTLSGGEAQRVKLAKELGRKGNGRRTLFLLDEPTTGLHPEDVRKLILLLQGLVDAGNTVCVVEHNLDLIKCCDWVIDLGPEGGEAGGYVIAEGRPEAILSIEGSYTGKCLSRIMQV